MTSLVELRQIAEQRAEDERTARERERAEAMARELAAEQAKRDAVEAKVRAEREERLRIEEARATAERELRLQLEAAQAAERSRMQAELEQRRMVEEMDLRRADIAKRRPKWMLAVTVLAVASALALTIFAIDRMRVADEAARVASVADAERQQAKEDARKSRERIEAAQRELDELSAKVDKAIDDIKHAQGTIALREAQAHLAALAQEQADKQRRLDEQKAADDKRKRNEKLDLTKCAKEALGCMDRKQ